MCKWDDVKIMRVLPTHNFSLHACLYYKVYSVTIIFSFAIAILSSNDQIIIIEMRVAAMAHYKWHFDCMGEC